MTHKTSYTKINQLQFTITSLSKLPGLLTSVEKERDRFHEQFIQVTDENGRLMSEIRDMKKALEGKTKALRSKSDNLRSEVLEVITAQQQIKDDVSDLVREMLTQLMQITSAYKEERLQLVKRSQSVINDIVQANEVEQEKQQEKVRITEKRLNECCNNLEKKRDELIAAKMNFEGIQCSLENKVTYLKATLNSCEHCLKNREDQLDSLKRYNTNVEKTHKSRMKKLVLNQRVLENQHLLHLSEMNLYRNRLKITLDTVEALKSNSEVEKKATKKKLASIKISSEAEIRNMNKRIESIKLKQSVENGELIDRHQSQIQALHEINEKQISEARLEMNAKVTNLLNMHEDGIKQINEQHKQEMIHFKEESRVIIDSLKNDKSKCETEINDLQSLLLHKTEECQQHVSTIMDNQRHRSLQEADMNAMNDFHQQEIKRKNDQISDLVNERNFLSEKVHQTMHSLNQMTLALSSTNQSRNMLQARMNKEQTLMQETLNKKESMLGDTLGRLKRFEEAKLLKDHLILSMKKKVRLGH